MPIPAVISISIEHSKHALCVRLPLSLIAWRECLLSPFFNVLSPFGRGVTQAITPTERPCPSLSVNAVLQRRWPAAN